MGLAFDLLLTILIELPIFAFFYKRKKRPVVLKFGLLVNLISWPIAHILKISTEINVDLIEILVAIGEGAGLWFLIECSWKKAFMMSLIANGLSFIATSLIHFDPEVFQNKQHIIIH